MLLIVNGICQHIIVPHKSRKHFVDILEKILYPNRMIINFLWHYISVKIMMRKNGKYHPSFLWTHQNFMSTHA